MSDRPPSVEPDRIFPDELEWGGDPDGDAVRTLVDSLRTTYGSMPAPAPRGELAELFSGPVRGATATGCPCRHRIRVRAGTRKLRTRVAVAVGSVVGALTLTTGLAAARTLPGPVEHAVQRVLHDVGIDVGPGVVDGPVHAEPVPVVNPGPGVEDRTNPARPEPRGPGGHGAGRDADGEATGIPGVPVAPAPPAPPNGNLPTAGLPITVPHLGAPGPARLGAGSPPAVSPGGLPALP